MTIDTVFAQTQGQYHNETIVFFHALPLTGEMWKEQMNKLSENYYTMAIDFPGFGRAKLPAHAVTFEFYIEEILSFLKDAGIKKAVWCGISAGGYLAMKLYEKAPEMCKGLILSNTKAAPDDDIIREKRWAAIKKLHARKDEYLLAQWERMIAKDNQNNERLKKYFTELFYKNSERAISTAIAALTTRTDATAYLKNIKVPTLIMTGEHDTVVDYSDSEILFNEIPDARLVVIEKAGHLSNLENPEAFNNAIINFLDELHLGEYRSHLSLVN